MPSLENSQDLGSITSPSAENLSQAGTAVGSTTDGYWRALEQWSDDPALQQQLASEFPMLAEAIARHDRRSFMRLLGASMALAGITATGCRRWPVEELRPHASRPEGSAPGAAEFYASLCELGGAAYGILAKSYDGRPIKIEGNPSHPASLGAASAWAQASVLDLYDPDRSRRIRHRAAEDGQSLQSAEITVVSGGLKDAAELDLFWKPAEPGISWAQFANSISGVLSEHRRRQGEGLAILVHPSSSPTEQRLIQQLRQDLPKSRWFAYQPLHRDAIWQAGQGSFGRPARAHYDLGAAELVVCVESDLLGVEPGHLQHARDWAQGRKSVDRGVMNRLVCLESTWTVTGSAADTRVPLKPSQCELAIAWLASKLGVAALPGVSLESEMQSKLELIAEQLQQAGSQALVAGGASLSPAAQQLIHGINARLGSLGTCIRYTHEPLADLAPQGYVPSIAELSQLLQGNVISTLFILGGNPVYDGPSDAQLDLSSTEQRPLLSVYLGSHENETSQLCSWHVPLAHGLECWSDGLSWDGTYTLGQPLIEPLFGAKSIIEVLGLIGGSEKVDGLSEVRQTFDQRFSQAGNRGWEQALHDGCFGETQLRAVSPQGNLGDEISTHFQQLAATSPSGLELRFLPDNRLLDGSFSNNAWLQELPDPLTKLTWDNAALISKTDADRLGIETGAIVRLMDQVEVAAMIMPGQAPGCVAVALGYGRQWAGRIGNGVGSNVFPLRTSQASYVLRACELTTTGARQELATTQMHHVVPSIADVALKQRLGEKGRAGALVHEATLEDFLHDGHSVHGAQHAAHAAPLFNPPDTFSTPHRWAMAIDLNACIGCSGCVVACQAENNIPVVGKQNVIANREMHWIRIDRYFKGDVADPDVVHVPTACAHCENAPCEQVCPVAATVHDTEGINAMVYNRCIGTRYCANNCPYKVRRFNYFDFHASDPREPSKPYLDIPDTQQQKEVSTLKKMVHNPDVTVRMRGVMEKCTYCVQRIAEARIQAKNKAAQGLRDSELVQEGELQTACQATCPTQAIVFGDLNDPNSAVSKARSNQRSYEMLPELNLGARTTYLAKVRNRTS